MRVDRLDHRDLIPRVMVVQGGGGLVDPRGSSRGSHSPTGVSFVKDNILSTLVSSREGVVIDVDSPRICDRHAF